LALADVAGDGRSAGEPTRRAYDRRDRQRHIHPLAVFLHPYRFVMLNTLAASEPLQDVVYVVVPGGGEQADVLADGIFGAAAIEVFGAGVPTDDGAVQALADDGAL